MVIWASQAPSVASHSWSGESTGPHWGRPVGVTVALDGSLFFSDDASNSNWHVSYTGK